MHVIVAFELVAVLCLGIAGQWLAWRFRLPSILVLLALGFLAGPVTGLLAPDPLLGELLFPIVSLAAAVILFEGGLTAGWPRVRAVAGAVRRLVTVGALLTWGGVTLAARYTLEIGWGVAGLIGATLVVTGPTVIGPLLRQVRPRGAVGTVAKLEGVISDPVGALLAVLVFQALLIGRDDAAATAVASGLVLSVVAGCGAGLAGAMLLRWLLERGLLPRSLAEPGTLGLVLLAFVGANAVQAESGLLAVTLMGMILASRNDLDLHHIVAFKENLRVILIAALFIILSARVEIDVFTRLPLGFVGFVLALLFAVRPLVVFLSCIGTDLNWREQLFLSWMAPRGIVAAAVSSVFGLELVEAGVEDGALVMPVVFVVIVTTVTAYGLLARPWAAALGLTGAEPQGFLLVGAAELGRELGGALREAGVPALLVDSSFPKVARARMAGLRAEHGLATSETFLDDLDLDGIGQLIAMTPNAHANALSAAHLRIAFDDRVYQVALESALDDEPPAHLRGHYLWGGVELHTLEQRLYAGWRVRTTPLTDAFDLDAFVETHRHNVVPLMVVDASGNARVVSDPERLLARPGERIISLAPPASSGDRP